MSDELTQLVTMMQEMSAAIGKLVANQEKLAAEQDHYGHALGELGLCLKNHAEVLNVTQVAVEKLWKIAGLPLDPEPPRAN